MEKNIFFLLILQFNQVTLSHLHINYLKITPPSKEATADFSQSTFALYPATCNLIFLFPDPPLAAGTSPKSWEISKLGGRTTPDPWQVQGWRCYQKNKSKGGVSLHLFFVFYCKFQNRSTQPGNVTRLDEFLSPKPKLCSNYISNKKWLVLR